jgi:phospholipid/cholesterol/gamma-HCH transport system substrate-binding protein
METRAPYVAVGAFVLVLIAGLVAGVLWFAQAQYAEAASYYDVYFTGSVTGLSTGSTVRLNGVPVGRVAEIRLDPTDPTRVRVTVELQPGLPIKTDTLASLELQGLAGGVYVNLTGGTREAPLLARKGGERYPVIASRPSELQRVVSGAPELVARALNLADALSDVLSDRNRQALAQTLDNLQKVSAAAAGQAPTVDKALASGAQSLEALQTTLNSANAILGALKTLIAPQGKMDATLQSVSDAAHQFSALAQHLDAVVAENQPQISEFSKNGFVELQQLATQTQLLVTQLSRIADGIERDPSRLLYGDRREGYRPQ